MTHSTHFIYGYVASDIIKDHSHWEMVPLHWLLFPISSKGYCIYMPNLFTLKSCLLEYSKSKTRVFCEKIGVFQRDVLSMLWQTCICLYNINRILAMSKVLISSVTLRERERERERERDTDRQTERETGGGGGARLVKKRWRHSFIVEARCSTIFVVLPRQQP